MKWLLAGVLIAATAGTEAASLEAGRLRLDFDAAGQWTGLALDGASLIDASSAQSFEASVEGVQWPDTSQWTGSDPVIDQAAGTVTVNSEAPGWRVAQTWTLEPEALIIRRTATITRLGDTPALINGATFRVPGVRFGGSTDALWCVPGEFPVRERAFANNRPGSVLHERGWTWSETGLAWARSESAKAGVLVNWRLHVDSAQVSVEQLAGAVSLTHRFHTLARLGKGQSIIAGEQVIALSGGSEEAVRAAGAKLAEIAHPGPPEDRPAWLEGAVIQELHPWGRLETWGAGDRGSRMPDLQAQLPFLRDLGIDGIWILPVSEKPPWVYHLPGFRHIDPQVTTPEQLRDFISAAHATDVRVLMDLVTYGVAPESPDVEKLPDTVWNRDREGKRMKAWSDTVLAADCSDPDWRAHIVDLTSWWVREFGADGFRLDCGGAGQTPNWQPLTSLHMNAGMLAGGVGQNGLIRSAIRAINPDAVMLPEAGSPAHFSTADLIFDYPLYMVCREATRIPDRATWVQELRRFLSAQQATHSPRALNALVRFTENHDCVAAQTYFGVGLSQAITAVQAFIPGVLLLYQEQEIGFSDDLRQWLRARRELPELRYGSVDYDRVSVDEAAVLPVLRATGDLKTLVLVNMGDADVSCSVTLPREVAKQVGTATDALSGEPVDLSHPVAIPACRPRIIALRELSAQTSSAPIKSAEEKNLAAPLETSELDADTIRTTVQVAAAEKWFVQTSEGLLTDRFIDRHRKPKGNETLASTMPPLWRCWRPFENGLWDDLAEPSLGAIAADGRAVRLVLTDMARVLNARMDDPSSVGEKVTISVDYRRGEIPFRIEERADGQALLAELRRRPAEPAAFVDVDAVWVNVRNDHYRMALARRHGGTIGYLAAAGEEQSWLQGPSEVYSDWGLFQERTHVSSDGDTSPRMSVRDTDTGKQITFWGHLHGPSWNGVQTAPIPSPHVAYRIRYDVDQSPTIRVTLSITALTDRPDTKAFFAYRIPFTGFETWSVTGGRGNPFGRLGDQRGKRVYEGNEEEELAPVGIRLSGAGKSLAVGGFTGDPGLPQNPFLLDGGPDTMHLFYALLNGESVHLKAHEPMTAQFTLTVGR